MRERPIIFSAPMVRAILDGRKTQTRRAFSDRVVKLMDLAASIGEVSWFMNEGFLQKNDSAYIEQFCPYGKPGDRLWVREAWDFLPDSGPDEPNAAMIRYWAGGEWERRVVPDGFNPLIYGHEKVRPSIHMPRWASRITLEIVSVRVERLQDISEADAIAEGAQLFTDIPVGIPTHSPSRWSMESPKTTDQCLSSARYAFANYFCVVNGKGRRGVLDCAPWDANPWIWVVEFKRVTP